MSEETTVQPMGEFDRLVGALFDPKPAFADIASRPARWWVPLLLLALLSLVFTFAYTKRVGWERFLREQIESSPRTQDLPAEQREEIIQTQVRWAPMFGYVFGTVYWAVVSLVAAGAFLFIFNVLLGSQLSFRQVFSITCYSLLPMVLGGGIALLLLFLKHPAQFDLNNPVASNLGVFLDPNTTPKWLLSLATSFDLFSLWVLALLATGFCVGARKISWSKSAAWVGATWAVWLLLKTGWVWIWT